MIDKNELHGTLGVVHSVVGEYVDYAGPNSWPATGFAPPPTITIKCFTGDLTTWVISDISGSWVQWKEQLLRLVDRLVRFDGQNVWLRVWEKQKLLGEHKIGKLSVSCFKPICLSEFSAAIRDKTGKQETVPLKMEGHDQPISKHPTQEFVGSGRGLSSKIPPYHLVAPAAMEDLCERINMGIERKGDLAWTGNSKNQELLHDVEFAIDRCGHTIRHAYNLIAKLQAGDLDGLEADNDASAIMWGGMYLSCARRQIIQDIKTELDEPRYELTKD